MQGELFPPIAPVNPQLEPPQFDGATYQPARDYARLQNQLGRVYRVLQSGRWLTLPEIASLTGDPEASISARIRDLRKEKFGGFAVEHRVRAGPSGLWEYRLRCDLGLTEKGRQG